MRVTVIFLSYLFLSKGVAGKCTEALVCAECIQQPSCKWCTDVIYEKPHCQSEDVEDDTCGNWESPQIVSNYTMEEFSNVVQVQPKSIHISNLRPGFSQTVNITIKSSPDYPLDLYYLMDFSKSMEDDKDNLKNQVEDLTQELHKIASDFTIGFGTFVDKPTAPFAYADEEKNAKPCETCQAVHSFNHEMKLQTGGDAAVTLKTKLENLNISSNEDLPEGGLDALMQAAVCEEEIGWRSSARKIIFFATDAPFHMGGDGKLAGIIRPNSATCALDENNKTYINSLKEDYPTIAQINEILAEKQIIPIFAVTQANQWLYNQLSDMMTHLSSVGILDGKSAGITQIIKDQIDTVTGSIQLNPQAPLDVDVEVTPKCSGDQVFMPNGQGCTNVGIGEEVKFEVTLTVQGCSDTPREFDIVVSGLDKIPVTLSQNCSCACETQAEADSATCTSKGDLACGSCRCREGNYGDYCECDQVNTGGIEGCKNPTSGLLCENMGKCKCGKCECTTFPENSGKRRWGEWCQCSNYECPGHGVCSDYGDCECGECRCHSGYSGKDCGCAVSEDTCREPGSAVLCSGPNNGECSCGKCSCYGDKKGDYCQHCADCGPLECADSTKQYGECVTCAYEKSIKGETDHLKEDCNCPMEISISKDKQVKTQNYDGLKSCLPVPYQDNCDINYFLHYRREADYLPPDMIEILIDRELDCPAEVNLIVIIAGAVGGTLAIGIALLATWKVCVVIADEREFKKFEAEKDKLAWQKTDSPLYANPIVVYQNPTFRPV